MIRSGGDTQERPSVARGKLRNIYRRSSVFRNVSVSLHPGARLKYKCSQDCNASVSFHLARNTNAPQFAFIVSEIEKLTLISLERIGFVFILRKTLVSLEPTPLCSPVRSVFLERIPFANL
jgi:hypothetical protein